MAIVLYLTLSEGTSPQTARPVLATADARVVRAVMAALARIGHLQVARTPIGRSACEAKKGLEAGTVEA